LPSSAAVWPARALAIVLPGLKAPVEVGVLVAVGVRVLVAVAVGVLVAVAVAVLVAVAVGVLVPVVVAVVVTLGVLVAVAVSVLAPVAVGVGLGGLVGVRVLVAVSVGANAGLPPPTSVGQSPQPSVTTNGTVAAAPVVCCRTTNVICGTPGVSDIWNGPVCPRAWPGTSISAFVAAPKASACRLLVGAPDPVCAVMTT
jgi:hypothetical protein